MRQEHIPGFPKPRTVEWPECLQAHPSEPECLQAYPTSRPERLQADQSRHLPEHLRPDGDGKHWRRLARVQRAEANKNLP
eukprot:1537376-Amphidinium_carterae.1